ncbi:MAG: CDP-6-deoxy-delta-3,4-glucoseen reductase, partial [Betaproteobacteria bacterium]|nr:CDP-6-deoxy-delta-3,4-glucoseen reductase [Betaproteobacteria bacterium]
MAWTVTIEPAAKQFMAEPDETLLEAALRQGIVLPYGCKDGACGSCKAKALAGSWEQGAHQPSALKSDEATQGFLLTCCSRASSDLRLECRTVAGIADIPVRKMPSRIASIERAAPDVAIIRLQLPANERLKYLAGQYLEILMRDGSRRAYSMASPPESNEPLELHIRAVGGGVMSRYWFDTAKTDDLLRLHGPLGTFFLRESMGLDLIFLATGTGIAPIKAL